MPFEIEKYLSHIPDDVKILILDLAASQGLNKTDYGNIELIGFVQGAAAMYSFQQKEIIKLENKVSSLEVEIDLLEAEIK